MNELRWDSLKNAALKRKLGVSFEEILASELITIKRHPNKLHQDMMFFKYENYVWVIPCVEEESGFFLKTLFPSRKFTKAYQEGQL